MIDTKRLAEWMDESGLPGKGAPLEATYLSGGTQNEIYKLVRDDFTSVIRIPPAAAPADRDNGIMREWRIIQGLDGTDVPHTAAIAACEDTSVLGRAFYLMGFVDGWSPMDHRGTWPAPFDTDVEARKGLAYQLAEGIALLSKVDWKAQGLQDLGRPEGFHDRQVDRWTRFFERIKARDIEGMDVATKWLQNHRPLDYIPGLMHGDYQFANVMYKDGAPAKLAALVDWEMGTVGDPKLDLGWMLMNWPEDTNAIEDSAVSYVDLRGMPNRSQMLAHYAEVSGRQVDDLDYYLVLAKWKLAIVLEQGFQRAGDDVKLQSYGPVITNLMKSAADLAESTDYQG
ncbi:phosphotransferase family protein [Rhodococcus artemisiae]|uniref:Phosphotransferase family protein n=1 Tax=Rhodococcus artemisiae TaxID=714159 RepID=A0ABU7L6E3_9NOCA|nr:phosphotransferase family protein [Rhodococcus artemisiae]MEE2056879.1 phosphotransferase family protein [Rhodococcus artemisiae]